MLSLSQPRPFLFCPMCGSPFPLDQKNALHKTCASCQYTLYEGQKATAGAVIIDRKRVLLVKRAVDPSKDLWDLPGGFVEPLENIEVAVRREVREEVGIDCEIIRLLGVFGPTPYLYDNHLQFNCDAFYLVKPLTNTYLAGDDAASLKWFPLTELPPDNMLAFASVRETLHILQKEEL